MDDTLKTRNSVVIYSPIKMFGSGLCLRDMRKDSIKRCTDYDKTEHLTGYKDLFGETNHRCKILIAASTHCVMQ